MIAFATLLLGLYLGPQTIELAVSGAVDRVELRLDGATVAWLGGPPWTADVDLGDELLPHELIAVAYGADGEELARARQTVNLPRPLAEAEVVVTGADEGRGAFATVTWNSVVGEEPQGISVSFDGRPLAVGDPRRIELPAFDPRLLHFLSVELEFDDFVSATVETTFGGSFAGQLYRDITAAVLEVAGKASVDQLQGRLHSRGRALDILAVDEGPADVVVVRDLASQEAVLGLVRQALRRRRVVVVQGQAVTGTPAAARVRWAGRLRKEQNVRFLWPFPRRVVRQGASLDLFPPSAELTPADGGLLYLMSELQPPAAATAEPRLADAVAVAGMIAASRNHRRAVLLVLGAEPVDGSQLSARQAATYLRSLGVPLTVWALAKDLSLDGWPRAIEITDLRKLENAAASLGASLARQRVVWVEGLHLPHEIEVEDPRARLKRAG